MGGITEQVQVVAETPLLQTTTASRSTVIDQEKVQNLPMSGRNPFTLAQIAPGVVGESGNRQSIQLRPFDNGGMDNISINGGRVRSNEFLLDGAPNSNNEGGSSNTLSFVPSPDAVPEIPRQTNTYDAQYGRTGGGTIAVSVRSGTNQPHGTGLLLPPQQGAERNLYENKVNGLPKSDVYHRQPGFTFGGPVVVPKVYDGRNKTFFFYSYEHLTSAIPDRRDRRKRRPTLERAGELLAVVNGVAGGDHLRPVDGAAVSGNVIPASRFDPVAASLLSYMPPPNGTPDAAGNNFFISPNSRNDLYDSNLLKLDHNFAGNQRLSGALRAQRPPRDPRQERPRGVAAPGRQPLPLERPVHRGPELDVRARRWSRA